MPGGAYSVLTLFHSAYRTHNSFQVVQGIRHSDAFLGNIGRACWRLVAAGICWHFATIGGVEQEANARGAGEPQTKVRS